MLLVAIGLALGASPEERIRELEAQLQATQSSLEACRLMCTKPTPGPSNPKPKEKAPSTPAVVKPVQMELVQDSSGGTEVVYTFTNTTSTTYSKVTVDCIGYDKNQQMTGMVSRSFFAHEVGPIAPGFKQRKKVWLERAAHSVACSVSTTQE